MKEKDTKRNKITETNLRFNSTDTVKRTRKKLHTVFPPQLSSPFLRFIGV